jgi:flagellar motor switch protein FliG
MNESQRAARAYKRFNTEKETGREPEKPVVKKKNSPEISSGDFHGFIKRGNAGNPYRKAAKLLLLLGKEQAATVLGHLSEEEIEKITAEIAGIRRIEKAEAELLLDSFGKAAREASAVNGGPEVAREMLTRAFGSDKCDAVIGKVIPFAGQKPFSFLEDLEGQQIFLLLRKESAAVIAIVMSFLTKRKGGELLKMLSPSLQVETVQRIGRLKEVSPSVVASIENSLQERLRAQGAVVTEELDGQNALAAILKQMDFREGERIIDTISVSDPRLKNDISKLLFTAEDLLRIHDLAMQRVLRDFEEREIALVLKGCPEDIVQKLLSNISDRRKMLVRSEQELLGAVRKSDVEKARSGFLDYVRKQIEGGEIILSGDDNPLV